MNYLIENIDKTLFNNVIKSPFTQFLHREMLKSSPDIKTMRGFINRFDIDLNYEIDSSGNTLLFLSLVKCPEVAKDLIKKGAEPNIINNKDSRKMTPLMEATATGFVELVNIMIIHGADVNAVDTEGFSSLHIAITNKGHQNLDAEKEKYDEIIQVLVQNRVNIFLSDTTRGCTPFMEATINGDIKTLQVLIDHVPAEQKYDMLNGKSRYNGGKTPLMGAINQDDLETAEFLINQEGIDVSVLADNDKDTALTELISSICTTPQTVENKKIQMWQ